MPEIHEYDVMEAKNRAHENRTKIEETDKRARNGRTLGIIGTILGGVAVADKFGLNLLNGGTNGTNGTSGTTGSCQVPTAFQLYEKECQDNLDLTKAFLQGEIVNQSRRYEDRRVIDSELFGLYQRDETLYNKLADRLNVLEKNEAVQAAIAPYKDKILLDKIDNNAVLAQMGLKLEAERRHCADEKIVNYVNNTFVPEQIAGVKTTDDTTPANKYDPICGCYSNRGCGYGF